MSQKVVIIGGSHAAVSVADNLRKHGFDGAITMLSDEAALPYQRPPLSKAYMSGEMSLDRLHLRPAEWYADNNIDLKLSCTVTGINHDANTVTTATGDTIPYNTLVLATGARPRVLPEDIGGSLKGVHTVRNLSDADTLMATMKQGQKLVVIGGGYIGLEAAAEASKKGLSVTVIEAAPRILQRVACQETADAFRALHQSHGVTIHETTGVARIVGDADNMAVGVELANGSTLECDLVIVGIGIVANAELASKAGLDVDGAIIVDEYARTSDQSIYACGDCTVLPFDGQPTRLESVQNAHDQAAIVAANILGQDQTYVPEPWFWSDQYDIKLQIAGFNRGYDSVVVRPGKREGSVAHFYFEGDRFLAVDCLNDAATYAMARRILAQNKTLTPDMVRDPDLNLKSLLTA